MNNILTAFSTVLIMFLYAVPGFALVKSKFISEDSIPSFAKLLMYVCQPALVVSSMTKISFSLEASINLITVFSVMLVTQATAIIILYAIFKKRTDEPKYRIYILASAMGNCSFMGIPILEALLPNNPEAAAYSAAASLALNILGWTVGSAVIMKDRKFISAKKIFLNPTTIAMAVAIPLFITEVTLPSRLSSAIDLVGKMSTPLCMIIMGMRLAVSSLKNILADKISYAVLAVKHFIFPVAVLGIMMLLPIPTVAKISCYIMLCCPSASVVLNFSEMLGKGQSTAAALVLLSTVSSIITIPIMILLI